MHAPRQRRSRLAAFLHPFRVVLRAAKHPRRSVRLGLAALVVAALAPAFVPQVPLDVLDLRTAAQPVPVLRLAPSIGGDRRVGRELTCSPGVWGAPAGEPLAFTYQWYRNLDGRHEAIAGATSPRRTVTRADRVGAENGWWGVFCRVTANGGPTADSAQAFIPGPRNRIRPQVTGERRVGRVLTCSPGEWDDHDGDRYAYTYEWVRNLDGRHEAIAGADQATRRLTKEDRVGAANGWWGVFCRVTADGIHSASSEQVFVPGPQNRIRPQVTGDRRVGRTLACAPGDWDDIGAAPYGFTYQWRRNRDGVHTDIPGATSATYVVSEDDRRGADNGWWGTSCRVTADGIHSADSAQVFVPGPRNRVRPQVTGDRRVGRTLRCSPGDWDDLNADGYHFTFQWLRNDDGRHQVIAGATEATYTLRAADRVGADNGWWGVFCRVTADALTTADSEQVFVPGPRNRLRPQVTGDRRVGRTLTCSPGAWDDTTTDPYTFTYQWMRNEDGRHVEIAGETAATHVVTRADRQGAENGWWGLFCRVKADGLHTADSEQVFVPGPRNEQAPRVLGLPQVGETLTCTPGSWDDRLDDRYAFTYQWYRVLDGRHELIEGATGAEHVTVPADNQGADNGWWGIICKVAADGVHTADSRLLFVHARYAPPASTTSVRRPPTVHGTVRVGTTVTCDPGGATDGSTAGREVGFRWLRHGSPIDGAIAQTYVLTPDDIGARLTCEAQPDGLTPLTSEDVFTPAPRAERRPSVTGVPRLGRTLACGRGRWNDDDAHPYPTTTRWLRHGVPIDGAASGSYVLTHADLGARITCEVRALDRTTAYSDDVHPADPGVERRPELSGTPRLWHVLACGRGDWDDDPTRRYAVTYQWLRHGVPIDGATGASYVVTKTDLGARLTCEVKAEGRTITYSDDIHPSTVTSERRPAVSGAPYLGRTLTCGRGDWDDTDARRYAVTHTWLRHGVPIDGATQATYVVGRADLGARLTCVARAEDMTSEFSDDVHPQTPAVEHRPAVTGAPRLGRRLTCSRGEWNDTALHPYAVTYRWLRHGVPIEGATSAAYDIAPADLDARLTCSVLAEGQTLAYADDLFPAAPRIEHAPAISGFSRIGGELRCSRGDWDDAPDGRYDVAWTWLRDGVPVPAADDRPDRYVVQRADAGRRLSCRVTPAGVDRAARTTPAISVSAPTSLTAPVLSGTPLVRRELRCERGAWDDAGGPPYATTYAWSRNGLTLTDQRSSTYALTAEDVGAAIRCTVRAEQLTARETEVVFPAWEPLVTSLRPDADTKAPGADAAYTLRVRNPNPREVGLVVLSVELPAEVAHRPGTTTGALTDDPQTDGRTLTWWRWGAPLVVPADGAVEVTVGVALPSSEQVLSATADVDADDGAFATPATGPTARIAVEDPASTAGCTIVGTAGDDVLVGTPGADVLCGLGGDDRLTGGDGDDELRGGTGADVLLGGLGADVLRGGGGHDLVSYAARAAAVAVTVGDGADDGALDADPATAGGQTEGDDVGADVEEVRGGRGPDRLAGGPGDDVLLGGPGADDLLGGGGSDVLDGESGDDRLRGQDGLFDRLLCGPGTDGVLADVADRLVACDGPIVPDVPIAQALAGQDGGTR